MMMMNMEMTNMNIYRLGMLIGKTQMIIMMMMTRKIVGNIGEKSFGKMKLSPSIARPHRLLSTGPPMCWTFAK